MGDWLAREDYLPGEIEQALGVDDYLLADYKRSPGEQVNVYIAFYASQRKGYSPHSPRVCLPGGGWRITDLSEIQYPLEGQGSFPINRAVLELNSQKQLVYYWFEQRGRRIASEYWMKWYLLVDSIMMNRTDGALVRVITPVHSNEDMAAADKRLQDIITAALPLLPRYIPD
jgi:EpsI family protein